jgi:hypothetical protein
MPFVADDDPWETAEVGIGIDSLSDSQADGRRQTRRHEPGDPR